MKTKNIFKTLVLAAVLVSACGKNEIADDFKGYTLPVTINVTRQGDDATKATYTDNGNGTGSLAFSTGDKLFVEGGDNNTAGSFKGVLTWVSGGTFSGSINTQKEYTGTADALLTDADYVTATLLPAGYESYAFLSIEDETDCSGWVDTDFSKAFALTKKAAVEQFSYERATSYSSGFALSPDNAIVSFTISGLAANTEVAVLFKEEYGPRATQVNVTTDASGVATFAVAVYYNNNIDYYTLTVDGIDITLPTKVVEAGHIYNISRSVAPAGPTAYTLAESTVGMIVGTDGKAYAVADKDNLPDGVTAVAMVAYKSTTAGKSLAIALANEGSMKWEPAKPTCEGKTAIGGNSWKLPTQDEWKQMFSAFGGSDASYTGLNNALAAAGGNSSKLQEYEGYWSSSEKDGDYVWIVIINDGGSLTWDYGGKDNDEFPVRACLAF